MLFPCHEMALKYRMALGIANSNLTKFCKRMFNNTLGRSFIRGNNPRIVKRNVMLNSVSFIKIYIFIAFALDESVILDVLQFPMKYIYQSCDQGRTNGRSNVNASPLRCLLTDVCVTLITCRHDVKRGNLAFWLFQNICKTSQVM